MIVPERIMENLIRLLAMTAFASGTLASPTGTSKEITARAATPPAEFTPNPTPGGGSGTRFKDSARFRVWNYTTDAASTSLLTSLEAGYSCFVEDLKWRSTGLSFNNMTNYDGPWYKLNVYNVGKLDAAANTGFDRKTGLAWLNVNTPYLTTPGVTVHEFGHAMTYAAFWWIDQTRTGAWWETIAQFVADQYLTSETCAPARQRYNQTSGDTLIELDKTIGNSYLVIVDGTSSTGNYYQAWPFFVYLVNNPDNYPNLGWSGVFPNVWTKYKVNSDETPLHVLERISAPTSIQSIVGRYWARMAFLDIGHAKAQALFKKNRSKLNYANLDSTGSGKYKPKTARRPRYMGANIIPLKGTGAISAAVTASAPFTATLVVNGASGVVRYTNFENGTASASVASGEEAMVVIANTPSLVQYDPFKLTTDLNAGLDYELTLTGATA